MIKNFTGSARNRFWKNAGCKQYAWWVGSYSIVILVSILINLAGYTSAIGVIERELAKTNASTIEHTKNIFDNYLSELNHISYNIIQSNGVTLLRNGAVPLEKRREYITTIMRDIQNSGANNQLFENSYVVLRERDICIDAEGMGGLDNTYRASFAEFYPSCDAWLNDLFNIPLESFRILTDKQGKQHLFFCRTQAESGFAEFKAPTAAIMTEVNAKRVSDLLAAMESAEGEGLYIASGSAGLLYANRPTTGWPFASGELVGTSVKNVFGQKQVVSVTPSAIGDLQYVRMLPNKIYLKNIRAVRAAFVLCYLLCVVFGGALVWLFSKVNVRNKQRMEKKLAEQNAYMREEILRQVLERKLDTKQADAAFLAEYDLQLQGKYFVVAVIDSVAAEEAGEEESAAGMEKIRRYLALYLPPMLEDGMGVYFCISQGLAVVVFNMQQEPSAVLSVCGVLSRFRNRLREDLGLDFICAVSRVAIGVEELPGALDEAIEAMNSRFLGQTDAIFVYDDDSELSGRYAYDAETDRKLTNLLMMGSREEAIDVIEETFSYNVTVKRINLSMLRVLTSEIISTLLKVAAQIDTDESLDFKELYLFSTQIYTIKQIDQAKNEILKYVNLLCDLSATHAHAVGDARCIKIQEYIAKNYGNPDLNVNMMASLFGITANWMSRYFKEQVGVGMTDYIVNYRISRAKELLREANKPIKQIAEETGFLSSAVFLRAFKRYEGVTPGQYRECLAGRELVESDET